MVSITASCLEGRIDETTVERPRAARVDQVHPVAGGDAVRVARVHTTLLEVPKGRTLGSLVAPVRGAAVVGVGSAPHKSDHLLCFSPDGSLSGDAIGPSVVEVVAAASGSRHVLTWERGNLCLRAIPTLSVDDSLSMPVGSRFDILEHCAASGVWVGAAIAQYHRGDGVAEVVADRPLRFQGELTVPFNHVMGIAEGAEAGTVVISGGKNRVAVVDLATARVTRDLRVSHLLGADMTVVGDSAWVSLVDERGTTDRSGQFASIPLSGEEPTLHHAGVAGGVMLAGNARSRLLGVVVTEAVNAPAQVTCVLYSVASEGLSEIGRSQFDGGQGVMSVVVLDDRRAMAVGGRRGEARIIAFE